MAKQKTTVESIGRKEENDKSKQNRQQIEQMKKRAAEDRKKAEAARSQGPPQSPPREKKRCWPAARRLQPGCSAARRERARKRKNVRCGSYCLPLLCLRLCSSIGSSMPERGQRRCPCCRRGSCRRIWIFKARSSVNPVKSRCMLFWSRM